MRQVIFYLFFICWQFNFAQNPNLQKVDAFISRLDQTNQAMGNLAIFQDQKLAYTRAWGYTNLEIRDHANPETAYRIGSISKTFTATIILQFIEENKLQLNTPLSEFFPKIPQSDSISIKALLNHHSGLKNITAQPDYLNWHNTSQSQDDLLNRIINNGLDFKPGSKAAYSNTNYILLTFIAESITHTSFAELLQTRITSPLHLKRTKVGGPIHSNKNEAYSYLFTDGLWKHTTETDMSVPQGAGNIISNAKGVGQFLIDLFDESVLSDSLFTKMITPEDGFGLGIFKIPFRDKTGYGHNGGIDGFRSIAVHFPNENTTVVLLLNATRIDPNAILISILNLYYGYPYTIPSFAKITQPEQYTGKYSSPDFPLQLTISVKSGNLITQATGQSPLVMIRQSEHTFTYPSADVTLEFYPKKKQVKLTQYGKSYLFTKAPSVHAKN